MDARLLLAILVTGTLVVLAISAYLLLPVSAFAQCGGPAEPKSLCTTCHEMEDPVSHEGEWHIIHAAKDICVNCHGGNGSAMDKDLAHAGSWRRPSRISTPTATAATLPTKTVPRNLPSPLVSRRAVAQLQLRLQRATPGADHAKEALRQAPM